MAEKVYTNKVNDSKLLNYFISSLKESDQKFLVSKRVFDAAVKDFFNKKLDIYTLSSLAHLLYFEISTPSNIHDWPDSYMTSLIADLFELDYYYDKSKEGDEGAQKEVDRVMEKVKDYHQRIK